MFDWHHTIRDEVAALAEAQGAELDAAAFTNQWRFTMFRRLALVRRGDLPWLNADQLHRRVLDEVLEDHPQLTLNFEQRDELNQVWHRLKRLARRGRRAGGAAQPLHGDGAHGDVLGDRGGLLEAQRHLLGWNPLLRAAQPLQARAGGLRSRRAACSGCAPTR